MDNKQEFLKKLLETFRIEADEGLKKISVNLTKLEKQPPNFEELIEVTYREAHSLKGASRAVNLLEIESICQSFESVMSALKSKKIELNSELFDILFKAVDLISDILNSNETNLASEFKNRTELLLKNLSLIEKGSFNSVNDTTTSDQDISNTENDKLKKEALIENKSNISTPEVEKNKEDKPLVVGKNSDEPNSMDKLIETKSSANETIRVSTKKLDSLLFQTEEMLSLKLANIQQTENLEFAIDRLYTWKKESSEILNLARNLKQCLETKEKEGALSKENKEIAKLIQFSEWSVSQMKALEDELVESKKFSVQEAHDSGTKIDALLTEIKDIITVPFSLLIDTFPKFIRDTSKALGKEIEFTIIGENVEVDRRILESLRHPLMHIIRNSIDYGIEKPEVRIKNKKSSKGNIKIEVERTENSKINVRVSDDGSGINIDKLRDLYIKNEKTSVEEATKITDNELLNYVFKSGITTSEIVTDLSGRGLGLAIVQEKIEQLGGNVTLETEKDKGTVFNIEIPLSLVTFRGILVKVAGNEFVLPTEKTNRILRINKNEIKSIENKATINFEGRIIPFVHLSDILGLVGIESDSEYIQILILGSHSYKVGFGISEVIGEQEILAKNFHKPLLRVRNISGATVLGSGKVVPILNVYDLVKSANNQSSARTSQKISIETETKQKTVLVVEDSITSRTLLKNILESAGYIVKTAIDGIDGFTKLKENSFDAVISDVEMPRMDGFELTSKIRADKNLSEMPVILVTSLSKTEDKERGIDVGANAYIIKSSFDQSNLLEILERLI